MKVALLLAAFVSSCSIAQGVAIPFFSDNRHNIIHELHNKGIVMHGDFVLKNGSHSSVYFDFRRIQSCPVLLKMIIETCGQYIKNLTFDSICGVPYGAVPLATGIGLYSNQPLIMCRKEAKNHGTRAMIEGIYRSGDTVLLVEDVVTSGSSILETIQLLEQQGLQVKDIIVCLDRQAGGVERLEQMNYRVHTLFTQEELSQ